MLNQIRYSQRLEIRLSKEEMETLDEMSRDKGCGKSEYVRALLEKDRNAHEMGKQITDERIKRFMVDVNESIKKLEA